MDTQFELQYKVVVELQASSLSQFTGSWDHGSLRQCGKENIK